jgi:hypothetical protein
MKPNTGCKGRFANGATAAKTRQDTSTTAHAKRTWPRLAGKVERNAGASETRSLITSSLCGRMSDPVITVGDRVLPGGAALQARLRPLLAP